MATYYENKIKLVALIQNKLLEMKKGETLNKEWVIYKATTQFGFGEGIAIKTMKIMTSTGHCYLDQDGNMVKA